MEGVILRFSTVPELGLGLGLGPRWGCRVQISVHMAFSAQCGGLRGVRVAGSYEGEEGGGFFLL